MQLSIVTEILANRCTKLSTVELASPEVRVVVSDTYVSVNSDFAAALQIN